MSTIANKSRNLWLSLKKDKIQAEIYYNGQLITTISVNEMNTTKKAVVNIDMVPGATFKILKIVDEDEKDDNFYNKDIYNK
jgi:hypothetical protein